MLLPAKFSHFPFTGLFAIVVARMCFVTKSVESDAAS